MLSQLARAASRRAAAPWCRAGAAAAQSGYATAVLPDLDYDYAALQPAISPQIMELHHSKHHQTYVNNLNVALDQYAEAEAKGNTQKMIALQPAIKFNGGGHVNHSIFWTNMAPPKDCSPPEGALLAAIEAEFGSLDAMKKQFAAQAVGVQGSGWAWLGYDQSKARLAITTTPNQDPCITKGLVPVLGLDVWEHAYYLDYKNVRPDYVGAFWEVTNWNNVAKRYADAGGD